MPSGNELAWLFGVARRVLSRQWRGASRFSRLAARIEAQPQLVSPDIASVVVQRHGDAQVHSAMARLRGPDQEILRLDAWEGLPHRDIAVVLEISIAAVDQRLHRAKKRFARAYESLSGTKPTVAQGGSA